MSLLFINTKDLQMKMKLLLALGLAQMVTSPLWASEAIETLAVFGGANGANPGNIIQGSHGDFYGTTYTGGTLSGCSRCSTSSWRWTCKARNKWC